MIVNGIIAIVTGYLLGAIPSAYIVVRLVKGKDICLLGSGTVGSFNTYRQAGAKAGIAVAIADIGKGTATIVVALSFLSVALPFVLAAGLAAIVGHMWMPFLKFRGGMGMGTAIGVMATLLALHQYWHQLFIFIGVIGATLLITRNIVLSAAIALLALPGIIWVGTKSMPFTILAAVIFLIIGLKFLPTARAAWAKTKNKRDFFFSSSLRRSGINRKDS
jgi:glycerol-3-phosphate acyltransferase PlsY